MYRLHYGNGQVSETIPDLAAAKRAYFVQVDFYEICNDSSATLCIQRYAGDGEWITMPRPDNGGPRI